MKDSQNVTPQNCHMYQNLPYPICILSELGHVFYLNDAFKTQFGYTNETLTGEHIRLLFNNEPPSLLKKTILPQLQKQKPWSGDLLLTNADKELVRAHIHASPLKEGQHTWFVCTLEKTNISAELHEKINELKVLFRSLFQKTSDILFLFNFDSSGLPLPFADVNTTACTSLGYSKKDLLEKSLLDIVESGNRTEVLDLQNQLDNNAVHYLRIDLLKKNGKSIHIDIEAQYVNHESRQSVLMIAKNLSEQKELENKLSQIEKLEAVGQLAGGIAHDFNNVLAGISGLAELALRKLPENHKASAFIKTIHQKANNTANMVQQLVAFSRKQKLSTHPISLNTVVKNNSNLLERYLGENVTFITDLQDTLSLIKADQASLDQIITNLCINARDAMPDGGDLVIKTRNINLAEEKETTTGTMAAGKYILFSVTDSGLGMSSDTIKRIFEPFFTTKDIGYGTGLGLSIVYGLIKQHGGYIECVSSVGEGTTFNMFFPWYSDKKSVAKAKEERQNFSGTETILIAEDEADLIIYLKESLEYFGYKILTAHNGVKALSILEKNIEAVDMIISDVVMPEMGGVELKLVAQNIRKDMKFLLISAYTNRIEPGIPFLQKPFQTEELAKMVRDILDGTYMFD